MRTEASHLEAGRYSAVLLRPVRGDLREAGRTLVYDEPGACRSSDCFQNSCNKTVR